MGEQRVGNVQGRKSLGAPPSRESDDELRALERRIAELEVATKQQNVAMAAADPAQMPERSDEPGPEVPEQSLSKEERLAGVERAFLSEGRDSNWSEGAEKTVREAVAHGQFQGTVIEAVECKATACQLRATHNAGAERTELESIFRLVAKAGEPMGGYLVPLDDGEHPTSIVYLVRREHDTPDHPIRAWMTR